jgi:hypothetical protein
VTRPSRIGSGREAIVDSDIREDLQARIRELRDRYQAFVAEVNDVQGAGRPAEGETGTA